MDRAVARLDAALAKRATRASHTARRQLTSGASRGCGASAWLQDAHGCVRARPERRLSGDAARARFTLRFDLIYVISLKYRHR